MSYLKTKRVQLGDNVTASNNFVLRQPDTADGTMRISNGIVGAETDLVTVTSAGNVGVGTSSPEAKLDVKSTLAITEASAANSNSELTFYSKFSDSQRGYVLLRCESLASGSSDLAIRTRNSFVEAERMRIDSAGRVTMPYQPAFRAGRNQGSTTAGNRIVFPNGYSNIGSNYNSTTGIFTAPVSGSYYFHTQLFTDNNSSVQVQMRKNDTKHIWTIYSGGGYGIVSLSGVIELSTSDYVDVLVDAGSIYGGGSNADCQFSGYLIG
jgi:hypothetical protein